MSSTTRRLAASAAAVATISASVALSAAPGWAQISARGSSWTHHTDVVARGSSWAGGHGIVAKGSSWSAVVIRTLPGQAAAVATQVVRLGGTVRQSLPIIDGFAASLPAGALDAVRALPGVLTVTPDSAVTTASSSYPVTTSGSITQTWPRNTQVKNVWKDGYRGGGVTVAVVDTGVAPVDDLSGRLIAGPDFSGEHDSTVDSFGHGTVMAGVIAGDGADSTSMSNDGYVGVAPRANVLSVKVAGRSGATDVSTVLAGLQWVASYRATYNIRVVELAWGTTSHQSPGVDPLDYAVERLWRSGIVVVVAAGNVGPSAGTITKPADDPAVITVGAYDDAQTLTSGDDSVTSWSSRGPTADGAAKPDVIAPGRTIVAVRAPGSYVEQQNPQALVGDSYIVGSGTSQASAVVAGVAALLLRAHPGWTPDQVKYAVMQSTLPLSTGDSSLAQGTGRVQAENALYTDVSAAPTQSLQSSGLGSLEDSRGGRHVDTTCNGVLTEITGEMDALCQPWDATTWTGDSWSGDSWSGDSWSGDSWSGDSWSGDSWSGDSWSTDQWATQSWDATGWPSPADGDSWSAGPRAFQ